MKGRKRLTIVLCAALFFLPGMGITHANQLAGYTGVGISGKTGVFAKVEKDGWTGIAFVNIEESPAAVSLTAYNDDGDEVATETMDLEPFEKVVATVENMFSQDITTATFISYASDRDIVGFQLNGSSDGMMLDALPGLFQQDVVLYFPHVATTYTWETEICLINTSPTQVLSGDLIAYDDTGQQVSSMAVNLAQNGRKEINVGAEFSAPDTIGYIVFESASESVCGYTKFYIDGKYRVAVPATSEVNTGDIHIPHIASNSDWWTGIGILNTTASAKTLTLEFDNGQTILLPIAAHEHQAFTVNSLFGHQFQPDIQSAVIKNASGIVGLELFGSNDSTHNNYLSGILIKDETAAEIYYPHIASDTPWWTGIVAYNPSTLSCTLTLTPFSADGIALPPQTIPLAGKAKYIGTASSLNFPDGTAWFRIVATSPIIGFELFGIDPDGVDDDNDGYSEYQGDCDDTDGGIHPGATDICGDGIDQDCDGDDSECDFYRGSDYYPLDPMNYVYNLGIVSITEEEHTFGSGTGQRIRNASLVCVPKDMFIGHTADGDVIGYGTYNREEDTYEDMSDGSPFVLLPGNIEINDTWTYQYAGAVTLDFTFIGLETVTVPAGTFDDCLKIQVDAVDSGGGFSNIYWYAKGVGPVRIERIYESSVGYSGCMAVTSENPLAILMQVNNPAQAITITGESGSQVSADGAWEGICNPDTDDGESQIMNLTISGHSFLAHIDHWVDSISCSGDPDLTQWTSGTLSKKDEVSVSKDATDVIAARTDLAFTSSLITINTLGVADAFNAEHCCGFSDWQVGIAKEIIGTECLSPINQKDIFYIDDTVDPDASFSGDDTGPLDVDGFPAEIELDTYSERL